MGKASKRIYLDHAATTPVDREVVTAMLPYFSNYFGNASSIHSFGVEAYEALETAREKVASLIGASQEEIIFTSGGTESDNLAIKGIAFKNRKKHGHVITSSIEHPAVLETCRSLETLGFKVTYLPVDRFGLVDVVGIRNAITPETVLISLMHANNEVGTLQNVKAIGEVAEEKEIPFHTDAVQSVGKVPVDVKKTKIGLLSLSSHKMYGPKGVGALYIHEDIELEPIIYGGGHERGLRSSTENIPGIVGLGAAVEIAKRRMSSDAKEQIKLRDMLIKGVLEIEKSKLNGHPVQRLPNNANFGFEGIDGEALLLYLNEMGIAVSTGSACSSRKQDVSHVLKALGVPEAMARGSLRITLGRGNTSDEMDYTLSAIEEGVSRLRSMSPTWQNF
ncbi:MAG: cysteine desulfurase NifS [Candidatus Hydrothermarchaeales archaeon]